MSSYYCPYFDLPEEGSLADAYANDDGICRRHGDTQLVDVDHQNKYCLSGGYSVCPVYSQPALGARVPLPVSTPQPAKLSRLLWMLAGLVLVSITLLAIVTINAFGRMAGANRNVPVFPTNTPPGNSDESSVQGVIPAILELLSTNTPIPPTHTATATETLEPAILTEIPLTATPSLTPIDTNTTTIQITLTSSRTPTTRPRVVTSTPRPPQDTPTSTIAPPDTPVPPPPTDTQPPPPTSTPVIDRPTDPPPAPTEPPAP